LFEDDRFDFIYTSVVLQHIEPIFFAVYLREFAHILASTGIVVFQTPDRVAPGASLHEKLAHRAHRVRASLNLRTGTRRALRRARIRTGSASRHEAVAEMHCVPDAKCGRPSKRPHFGSLASR